MRSIGVPRTAAFGRLCHTGYRRCSPPSLQLSRPLTRPNQGTTTMSAGRPLPGTPVPMHRWKGAGGISIAGDAWGDPKGPLVLLQHGGGQTRHAWKDAGERLGAAGYRAIAFDARGHGDSEWAADRSEEHTSELQ